MSLPNHSGFRTLAFYEAEALLAFIGFDPNALEHRAVLLEAIGGLCIVTDCDKPSRSGRMCDAHYRAHTRLLRTIRDNQTHTLSHRKAAA